MNPITSITTRVVPINNVAGKSYAVLGYIEHDEVGCLYSLYYKTEDDLDFVNYGLISTYGFSVPLNDDSSSVYIKIVAKKAPDPDVEFITSEIVVSGNKKLVCVTGNLVSNYGEPLTDILFSYRLMPEGVDFEAFGSIIYNSYSGEFKTDESGFFEIYLIANKGSDPLTRIAANDTFYEFSIGGKTFYREVDKDNGDSQSFFELSMPENLRYKKDNFYDMRHI